MPRGAARGQEREQEAHLRHHYLRCTGTHAHRLRCRGGFADSAGHGRGCLWPQLLHRTCGDAADPSPPAGDFPRAADRKAQRWHARDHRRRHGLFLHTGGFHRLPGRLRGSGCDDLRRLLRHDGGTCPGPGREVRDPQNEPARAGEERPSSLRHREGTLLP